MLCSYILHYSGQNLFKDQQNDYTFQGLVDSFSPYHNTYPKFKKKKKNFDLQKKKKNVE